MKASIKFKPSNPVATYNNSLELVQEKIHFQSLFFKNNPRIGVHRYHHQSPTPHLALSGG